MKVEISLPGMEKNTLEKLEKIRRKTELKIEIEVKNLKEYRIVQKFGKGLVDIVMLDNFSIQNVKKAVLMNWNGYKIEISGGININNIIKYSGFSGINYISVGALTHSTKSTDISLNFITWLINIYILNS